MTTHNSTIVWQNITVNKAAYFVKEIYETTTFDNKRLKFIRKKLPGETRTKGAVILIHGFAQNRYTWHGKRFSFENYLAYNGYDVYNIELRGHGINRKTGYYPEQFEDYINKDMPSFVNEVKKISGEKKVFLLGHSLGGAIIYASAPQLENDIRGLVTIAGLYYFGKGQKIFHFLSKYLLYFDYFLPDIFNKFSVPMDYLARFIYLNRSLMETDFFVKFPIQGWFPKSMSSGIYRERLLYGFDRTSFAILKLMMEWAAKGRFFSSDKSVDYAEKFDKLNLPLLVITGNKDMLCSHKDAYPAYLNSQSKDKEYRIFTEKDGNTNWGHIDLLSGDKAPEYVWPYILSWLNSR